MSFLIVTILLLFLSRAVIASGKESSFRLGQAPAVVVYPPTYVVPGDPFWYCGPNLAYPKAWTYDYSYWYCVLPYYAPYYYGWWYPRYKGKPKYPAKGYKYYYVIYLFYIAFCVFPG